MDLNSLRDSVANLTLYDLKAGVRKVQNAVMNFTEMEAKVREATNNEPWGASSSVMNEIANGTFNYQTLNEIMPMIYRRFTEKAAEEWRQIYKALQLLEYLIKHGSERVIDDARSHLTLLKMLRQFHFIDQNGKDQGINVRNRAKELTDLLGDVDRIRAERKKARNNKAKYTGVEGGAGGFSGTGSSSRYGGYGNDPSSQSGPASFGGYSGGVYGDGGGFGGQTSDYQEHGSKTDKFEEYDEGGEADRTTAASSNTRNVDKASTKKPSATGSRKPQVEVDLFSFDESASAQLQVAPLDNTAAGGGDDEFDDFQSAAPSVPSKPVAAPLVMSNASSPAQTQTQKPALASTQTAFGGMAGFTSLAPTPTVHNVDASSAQSRGYQSTAPNYFQSVQVPGATSTNNADRPTVPLGNSSAPKSASNGDAFGALWATASSSVKKSTTAGNGPAMGQLAKEKSSASIWGVAAPAAGARQPPTNVITKNDDLLG